MELFKKIDEHIKNRLFFFEKKNLKLCVFCVQRKINVDLTTFLGALDLRRRLCVNCVQCDGRTYFLRVNVKNSVPKAKKRCIIEVEK